MEWFSSEINVRASRRGLQDITAEVATELEKSGALTGMLFLFIRHTSASLCISENYDPTARRDLEAFLGRLAPDGQDWHRHTLEGEDDSSSHMRSVVTAVDLTIPVDGGKMSLGTWQGIYLCEHRKHPEKRTLLVRVLKMG
jgi:secondary thiamine-phosphate synthase enzyme